MDRTFPPAPTPLASRPAVTSPYPGRHRLDGPPRVTPLPDTAAGTRALARQPIPPAPPVPVALRALPVPPAEVELDDTYDVLGDSELDLLLDAAYDGPARKPLLGRLDPPNRLGKTLGAVAGVAVATLALLSIGSSVVAASPESEERDVVATYTRPDGQEIDVRDVGCSMLAADVLSSRDPIGGNPSASHPVEMRAFRPVVDNRAEIAALAKGDVARTALVCRTKATWALGEKRTVQLRLVVEAAESSMDSTSARVTR